jgi:uncharacterized membrane protein YsdA (DUF1294 family)
MSRSTIFWRIAFAILLALSVLAGPVGFWLSAPAERAAMFSYVTGEPRR